MIGKIYIQKEIGKFDGYNGIQLIDVIEQVRRQPDATEFEVYIKSNGGVVSTGFDIYNYLRSLGVPITTIAEEIVGSIATVIYMAGDVRKLDSEKFSEFFIHLPIAGIGYATAEEIEIYSKEVKSIEDQIVKFYCDKLNLSKEAVYPLLKNETYLTSSQLEAMGFTTKEPTIQLVAYKGAKINSNKLNKQMSKKSKFLEVFNALFMEAVNAKVVFTAEEKELTFPDLDAEGVVSVGDVAKIDGAPAEGEIVIQDGTTYVFEGGKVIEIIEKKEEEESTEGEAVEEIFSEEDEIFDALLKLFEVVDVLNKDVTSVKKELEIVNLKRADVEKELATAKTVINKLKGVSSEAPVEDKKDKSIETAKTEISNWAKARKLNRK